MLLREPPGRARRGRAGRGGDRGGPAARPARDRRGPRAGSGLGGGGRAGGRRPGARRPARRSPRRSRSPTTEIRAAAALALSGRFAPMGRQAAEGLTAWASAAGARLRIEDDRSDPELSAALAGGLARLGGPALRALRQRPGTRAWPATWPAAPRWSGTTAPPPPTRTGARLVDVLGPAESYWRGLPAALGPADAAGRAGARAGRLRRRGRRRGACAALAGAAGIAPVATVRLAGIVAARGRRRGRRRGRGGVGRERRPHGGRARAGPRGGRRPACARRSWCAAWRPSSTRWASGVVGWLGPVQWDGEQGAPAGAPAAGGGLPGGPGARRRPRRASGPSRSPGRPIPTPSGTPRARCGRPTFLGPFAVDAQGRQTAHAPAIVRWEAAPGGPRRRVVWRPSAPEA